MTYGAKPKIVVLPLPVPAIHVSKRDKARQLIGLSADEAGVLYLSRINYKKGIDVLLEAFVRVLHIRPKTKLLIAGDGDKQILDSIESFIKTHSLEGRVQLLGMVIGPLKENLLAGCDVFALPSLNENFGVSVVESLSAGLPVVISENVYIANDIRYSDAVSVCERTPQDFAEGIVEMLERRARSESVSVIATQTWLSNYSSEKLIGEYKRFYESVQ